MNSNLLNGVTLAEKSAGPSTVTRAIMRERTFELAVINGRSALDASKADWEKAKQELTGVTEADSNWAAVNNE